MEWINTYTGEVFANRRYAELDAMETCDYGDPTNPCSLEDYGYEPIDLDVAIERGEAFLRAMGWD